MTAIDVSEAMCQYMLTKTAITNVCSTRIYPDVLPEKCTLPAITYEEVSDNDEYDLSGRSPLAEARVQVNCYASTRAAANALGRIVRREIGEGVARTMGGMYVRTCRHENGQTVYEPPIDGSDSGRYVRTRDFILSYVPSLS